jgi:hypothetical protein
MKKKELYYMRNKKTTSRPLFHLNFATLGPLI